MNDEQLLRYSRHIMLPSIDFAGQQKLLESTVLIVGLGGLGSPAAMYLASSGVGNLWLADFDTVELSNLQRQIVHTTERVGQTKVESAKTSLEALNPDVRVTTIRHSMDLDALCDALINVDVVLDCSDNFTTRFAINEASVRTRTPLVSGAAIRFDGQVTVFDPNTATSPCYRCLYAEDGDVDESCARTGILAPIVGLIGCIQATETIKLLADCGEPLVGRLLALDGFTMEWQSVRLPKDPQCPCCGIATALSTS